MKKGYIYTLNDPISNEPRYVGWTVNMYNRLAAHITDSDKGYKTNWVKSLKNKGLLPIMECVDEVPLSEWVFWEQHYISLYKSWGFKLVNLTIGGDGTLGYRYSQELKDRIQKTKREKGSNFIGAKNGAITKRKNGEYNRLSEQMKIIAMGRPKRAILQYSLSGTFIKEWASTPIASKELKISSDNINRCCNGKYGQTHGFQFKYKTDNYSLTINSYKSNSIRKIYLNN